MQIIDIYKVLYNDNYGDYSLNTSRIPKSIIEHKEAILARRNIEKSFHNHFWSLLSNNKNAISSKLFKAVISLLLDANTMQSERLAECIKSINQ